MKKFKKILIANRGEIAVRVMRTCREMGISSVAVYSAADRCSQHVRYADEAYFIGNPPAAESYLNIDRIVEAALKCGADAIHPGYGFLSENAVFARHCIQNGINFIGPSPEVILAMGNKIEARKRMIAAGIPVVPGNYENVESEEVALELMHRIGLPVIIKAAAGGGGKGMRLVTNAQEMQTAYRSARSEALHSFNNESVYIEKYISSPHHIEFQILADNYGNAVHLFERECSVQRRHQKMIEETPSPLMTEDLRERMGEMAVRATIATGYIGAGTIEFLVGNDLNYYFLEMNTRLQVEHPITERVTGIDIVRQQILIAQGEKLRLRQDKLIQHGHALECRIYAEDPDNNFLPQAGKINRITEPTGFGIRTDSYLYEGYEVPVYYDSMVSKLIVWATTREESIKRMKRALYEYKITGIKTTIQFLEKIMNCPDFVNGTYDTHFIEKNGAELRKTESCDITSEDMVIVSAYIDYRERLANGTESKVFRPAQDRWKKTTHIHHF
jgi:acetyl-CoA carboxylase biotin carboxylase subunit